MVGGVAPDGIVSPRGGPEQRRLLVLTYHFPPDPAMGGMRWAGLARHLARLGWKTWVLTAVPAATQLDGVSVESCAPGRTLNDLYVHWRRRFSEAGVGARSDMELPSGTGQRHPSGLLRRLRAEGAALLTLLSEGRGWALRAGIQARRLIRRVQPHVVVSTSPPVGAHLAAWLATRGRKVRWLVDFRDPWAGPVSSGWLTHPYLHSRLAWAATVRLERLVVQAASGVIATTPELVEALRARYPRSDVTWVRNGADGELLPHRSRAPYPGLSIAHVGTLYGKRDLRPVLRALRLFLQRHPEAATDGTRLRTAGHIESALVGPLEREVMALDLAGHVEFLRVIPRAAALDLVARSRLAVVLAQNQETEVPAKLYEAVATGVPTVMVAPRNSAPGREAMRLGVAVVEPEDVAAMASLLEAVWSDRDGSFGRSQVAIDYHDLAVAVSAALGAP